MTTGISAGQAFPDGEHATVLLVRYGEIALKSPGVHDVWERQLNKNIREAQLYNLIVLDRASGLPINRPLIGFDKTEIITIARKIGTFEPSIMPVSNCCCAVPNRPATRADPQVIEDLEESLAGNTV